MHRLSDLTNPVLNNPNKHPKIGCTWHIIEVEDDKTTLYVEYIGRAIREAYVDAKYLSTILEREGFSGVVKLIIERLPPKGNQFGVRIGDFGEIVGHTVLIDLFGYTVPVIKLRYKTNWERAAFGVDIIAFRLSEDDPTQDAVIFSEVKTSQQKEYGVEKVFEEINQLVEEGQPEAKQKMRNAVRFVSERLYEQGKYDLEKRIYRFLNCYTNSQYVEAFFPFLVRDKKIWTNDVLDNIVIDKPEPDRIILCIFLISDLEEIINKAFEKAADMEV